MGAFELDWCMLQLQQCIWKTDSVHWEALTMQRKAGQICTGQQDSDTDERENKRITTALTLT